MNSKKLLFIALTTLCLSACSEKAAFKEAVRAKMQDDSDIKDYKIDPERMADCVVDTASQNMPGIFGGDPERLKAYVAYTKMLNLPKAAEPQKSLEELRNDFGSAKGLAEANRNFSESLLMCQTALANEGEEAETAKQPASPAPTPIAAVPAAPAVAAQPTPAAEPAPAQPAQ